MESRSFNCKVCKHYKDVFVDKDGTVLDEGCSAYPRGIPNKIFINPNSHNKIKNGVLFEPKPGFGFLKSE